MSILGVISKESFFVKYREIASNFELCGICPLSQNITVRRVIPISFENSSWVKGFLREKSPTIRRKNLMFLANIFAFVGLVIIFHIYVKFILTF